MDELSNESSDDERVAIRDELKSMSFEELLKLKEEVGLKYYNSTVFKTGEGAGDGSQSQSISRRKEVFKRGNKNRPREESSKVHVRSALKTSTINKAQVRDPRFDSLCGDFNEDAFLKNYGFVNDIRKKEIKKLRALQDKEKDPENKSKIKFVLDRMTNQERSRQLREVSIKEKQSERGKNLQLIKEGKKPHFKGKGEIKAIHLIDKYEKLKAEGKLEKYVKRKNKEQSRKSSFKLPI